MEEGRRPVGNCVEDRVHDGWWCMGRITFHYMIVSKYLANMFSCLAPGVLTIVCGYNSGNVEQGKMSQ